MQVASAVYLCVCVRIFVTFCERGGKGRKMLPVTPSTSVTHLSSPIIFAQSLHHHQNPFHFLWLSYFVFQWTFIALLNLNPPLSPCTAYSPLPSDSLFTFPVCSFLRQSPIFSHSSFIFHHPLWLSAASHLPSIWADISSSLIQASKPR